MSNKFVKKGKKLLTVGTSLSTIIWSLGFFAAPITFAASSGDLIKITCTGSNSSVCDAVYYLGANGKRYVFPNEKGYKTWYSDFSGVKNISQTEMESYPIGGNATYRPGVKMVKITTDPKVYAVSKNGTLRWVTSEAMAKSLYGDMWNKQVDDVPDAFFVNYTIGADITSAGQFDKAAETSGSATINADKNLGGGGGTPVGGSTLTIALSPDTPASGLVFGSAARVPFTTFTLTASSDGDVVVDSVTIERGGLSQDAEFSNFDLLNAETMLPFNSLSKSLNSDHRAVFGDDITVKAGTSKKIIIGANMTSGALSSYAGEVPLMSVVALTLKGSATLVGTLPISGNYQTVNGTLTVGSGAVAVGSNNPAASTKEVGTKDYIVSSIKITNNSTQTNQDFKIKGVTWTQNGSAAPEDIANVRLVNTNTSQVIATVAAPDKKKISFTGIDVLVKKGDNINLDVRLDIKGGSARTISIDVDQQADVVIYDTLRGYNVLPTYTDSASATVSASPYYNAPNTTVGNGKLRVEALTITQNKIPENSKKTLIGRFKFVVDGETLNFTSLGFNVTTTTPAAGTAATGAITNVLAKDKDGKVLTSPVDPASLHGVGTLTSQKTATSTDTVSLPVGEHEILVYGDLDSNFTTNDTIQLGIHPEAITVRGDISGNLITPTPAGQTQSTSLTVKPAAVAVSLDSTPSAQTVIAGTNDFELARIVLDASDSGSDIRITQLALRQEGSDTSHIPDMLSGFELFDGNTKIPVDTTSRTCSGTTCSTINTTATTTLTIAAGNLSVGRATTKVIRVVVDIGTATSTGNFRMHLAGSVTAIDQEAQSLTPTYTEANGGLMTLASAGTLQLSVATDPKSSLLVAGTTVDVGKFVLKAKNEALKLNAFAFDLNNPDGGVVGGQNEIDSFELWELGGTASLGSVQVNGDRSTITPAVPLLLNSNAEKTYVLKAKWEILKAPSQGSPATSGGGVRVLLSYIDVKGTSASSGTVTLNGFGTGGSCTASTCFNTFSIFKSLPTVALMPVTNKITANGQVVDILKFSVKADSSGPIGLGKFSFGVSTSTVVLDPSAYYLYDSSSSSVLGTVLSNTNDFALLNYSGDTSKPTVVEARFDVNNDDSNARNTAGKTEHLILSAGSTRYFTLQGTVLRAHDGTANNESVAAVLAGDASFAGTAGLSFGNADNTATTGIDRAVDQDDFIWSDLNFDQYSSSTATNQEGWYNGYRVPGMEDTSSTPTTITD